jgi:hypothetical protein
MQISGFTHENPKTVSSAHNLQVQRRTKTSVDFLELDSVSNQESSKHQQSVLGELSDAHTNS